MSRTYQICTRCVMDTSDPDITFDDAGVCNHCITFEKVTRNYWHPDAHGAELLSAKLDEIRDAGRGKEYDCIIGLSGGVDSSYLALKLKDWNLRPLVVHVDAGWNSELATANIETLVKYCGFDLHTVVIDWPEIRDLQLAYLKAGVANQDVPQDHAFFTNLYKFAVENGIKYILSGGNLATEAISADAWGGSAMDAISLKAIHKRFGSVPLRSYETISFLQYYFMFPFLRGMRTVRPLNFMPYDKAAAVDELTKIGWKSYGRKHGESRFTKLYQNYYLPERFGFDKRRMHYASMIVSGQLGRDDALRLLEEPLYEEAELQSDIAYFCKKLGITREEFDEYLHQPLRGYQEFPNWDSRHALAKRVQEFVRRLLGRDMKVYS